MDALPRRLAACDVPPKKKLVFILLFFFGKVYSNLDDFCVFLRVLCTQEREVFGDTCHTEKMINFGVFIFY